MKNIFETLCKGHHRGPDYIMSSSCRVLKEGLVKALDLEVEKDKPRTCPFQRSSERSAPRSASCCAIISTRMPTKWTAQSSKRLSSALTSLARSLSLWLSLLSWHPLQSARSSSWSTRCVLRLLCLKRALLAQALASLARSLSLWLSLPAGTLYHQQGAAPGARAAGSGLFACHFSLFKRPGHGQVALGPINQVGERGPPLRPLA